MVITWWKLLPAALLALVLTAGPRAALAQMLGPGGYGPGGYGGPGAYGPGSPGAPGSMSGFPAAMGPTGSAPKRAEPTEVYITPDATAPLVVDVRVEGAQPSRLDRIRTLVRTRKGRQLDARLVEEDVRRLHASKLFLDVRTVYTQVPGGVVLTFQVIERPTLEYVKFQGNKKVKAKTLAKQAGLKKGDSADPYAVEDARGKLESWLHEKGHTKASVTILEGDKPGDRGAIFMVHEGPIQRVGKVVFEGNSPSLAPDGRLQQLIGTKRPFLMIPKIFPGFKGFADRDKVDQDVETLTDYYRGLGYFQAKVAPEVEYDNDQAWATVRFVIHEGVRYKVRNVSFQGNTKRTADELQKPLKLVSGDYFDREKLKADVSKIEELYGSRGYLFCSVDPETRFLEQPGELDLIYKLSEGARCRIGRINVHIEGDDPRTRRMVVLNRLDFRPGDIADIRKIRDSERRLRASGLFLTDPTLGEPPKIVFHAPDEEDELGAYAEKPKPKTPNGFRGQSPDPDMREPEQLVELVVLPNNEIRVIPLGENHPASWQAARPVWRGQIPDEPRAVRFQDMGTYSMPTFEVNQVPRGYRPPPPPPVTYPASQPTAAAPQQPYAVTPGQVAPNYPGSPAPNPRYQPSTTPQPAPQPFLSQPATPAPYAPPPTAVVVQPQTPPPPAPQATSPYVPPGGFAPAAPSPAAPGVLPPPQGYDSPSQLFPNSEPGHWLDEPTVEVPFDIHVLESQTGRLMLGVGVNSNAGVVGNIVLDEQNFDWRRFPRGWEDIRNATAWRGAGQHLRIEAMPGSLVQRYLVSFTEPYLLDTPISLGLSGYFFSRQYRNWFEERLGGRVSLGYQFAPDLTVGAAIRAENVNISQPTVPTPPQLAAVLGNNGLYTARFSLTNDTRDSPFLPSQGHRLMFAYEQAFGDFSYPRGEFEGSQYFLLRQRADGTGKHTLSFITVFGITGTDTPIFENFFAGGFGTLRGFAFRGASPTDLGVQVGGRFQWINTVEYMFPITATDALRMVAFVDFGTVEPNIKIDPNTFRVAPGLGLRVTIPALGPAPLAFDFAVPVAKAATDREQVFSFNMGFAR